MKRLGVVLLLTCAFAAPAAGSSASPSVAPIAHYPLSSDGLDALGINGPMMLNNATFQDGGVYCNGIYPSTPGGSEVRTPDIPALGFGSFAVSVEFKIDQHPASVRPMSPVAENRPRGNA